MPHNISPLAVLQRGYAIARDEQDHVVKDTGSLSPAQSVKVRLARGEFVASVKNIVD